MAFSSICKIGALGLLTVGLSSCSKGSSFFNAFELENYPTSVQGSLNLAQVEELHNSDVFEDQQSNYASLFLPEAIANGSGNPLSTALNTDFGSTLRKQNLAKPKLSVEGCEPSSTGDTTDADHDTVPVDALQNVKCSTSDDTMSIEMDMQFGIKDADDADPKGGFSMEVIKGLVSQKMDFGGGSMDMEARMRGGLENQKVSDGNYVATSKTLVGMIMSIAATQGSATVKVIKGDNITLTTSPVAGDPLLHNVVITGFTRYFSEAQQSAGEEVLDVDVTLAVSSENLIRSSECNYQSGGFQSGDLLFKDAKDHTIKITYTNCNAAVTFDGSTLNSI
jgi:hypothetical protein